MASAMAMKKRAGKQQQNRSDEYVAIYLNRRHCHLNVNMTSLRLPVIA
jgi:hypothetical protein